jgi:hypothetical protein
LNSRLFLVAGRFRPPAPGEQMGAVFFSRKGF